VATGSAVRHARDFTREEPAMEDVIRRRTTARHARSSLAGLVLMSLTAAPAWSRTDASMTGMRPNVLLVTLDTTRADRLGCYGAAGAVTPALDGLAAGGTLFEHAYTPSPMTLPAHATIMTGLQPPRHGLRVNGKSRLAPSIPTLAEILSGEGYQTGAFVAAFVLDRQFGLDRGFAVYDDDLAGARKQVIEERLSVYRPGDRVVDAALGWLDSTRADAPFFAWVHLYDPHFPHYVNEAMAETRFAGVASYDAEVAFMDRQVGRLLDFLDRRGLRGQTLVLAIADHGEGLGDHGEHEHGYLLNEEVLRVPFVAALPGAVRAGQRVQAVVSSVDVLPTVLDVLGVRGGDGAQGRSLRVALEGGPIVSADSYAETDLPFTVFGWSPLRSLTTERWKYVRTTRPELYDRTTDRNERANLAPARSETAAQLAGALVALEDSFGAAPAAAPVALDADARRRLAALGYIDDGADGPPVPAGTTLRDVKDMLPVKHLGAELAAGIASGTIDAARALAVARELVARSPESATFHVRLGGLLLRADQTDEAAREFAETIRLQPDHAEARNNLGHLLVRERRYTEAITQLTEAARLRPDLAEAHLGLGLAESGRGEKRAAVRHFAQAVRLDPSSAEAHLNLGNALARVERRGRAGHEYREALRLRPDFGLAHHALAALLARAGKTTAALQHASAAVRHAPDFAAAHDQLGRLLAEEGRLGEAIEHYARAVRLAPATPEFHDDLAAAYAAMGRKADALASAREGLMTAERAGRTGLVKDIQRRIAFYERAARASNRPTGS
jgi:arylsulfatase A-like enzyme/Flp pilus assembly protein TadD